MGRGSVSSKFLIILNTLYVFLGVGLITLSVLFYIKINKLTSLRNDSLWTLDTTIYWPQAMPWMYASVGAFIVIISGCACLGVAKKSRAVILTHTAFQILAVSALVGIAAVTLVKADSKASDDFIAAIIDDAFHHMEIERGEDVKKGFAALEMSSLCCGAHNSTSYKYLSGNTRNYKYDLPVSCCNTENSEHQVKECPSDDQLARSRPGCIQVVTLKVKTFIKIFAGAAILAAFIGLLNLVSAVCLSKGLMNKKKCVKQDKGVQRRSNIVISTQEFEFDKREKVPLKV